MPKPAITLEQLLKSCDPYIRDCCKILSTKFKTRDKLKVETPYGLCELYAYDLLRGKGITIFSAVDKTKFFKEKSKEIHNGKYDYSKSQYKRATQKTTIICPIHGEFQQTPTEHMRGRGCSECGKRKNLNGWKDSEWLAAGEKSKYFDKFKLYIIRCNRGQESFVKIGKTFVTVETRFRSVNRMPYDYEILHIVEGTAKEISELERELKRLNKNNKYTPSRVFDGYTECFSEVNYGGQQYA